MEQPETQEQEQQDGGVTFTTERIITEGLSEPTEREVDEAFASLEEEAAKPRPEDPNWEKAGPAVRGYVIGTERVRQLYETEMLDAIKRAGGPHDTKQDLRRAVIRAMARAAHVLGVIETVDEAHRLADEQADDIDRREERYHEAEALMESGDPAGAFRMVFADLLGVEPSELEGGPEDEPEDDGEVSDAE
ncbi:MAG: hypothetical protein ACOC9H_01950 [Gemmatimonadota bacterium]